MGRFARGQSKEPVGSQCTSTLSKLQGVQYPGTSTLQTEPESDFRGTYEGPLTQPASAGTFDPGQPGT
jgi:hypothetical protein